uniref:Inositol 1,4,5-trisphosphate receptor-interacting protein n=1 Tax=Neogobius melanostomus TaxID=47308 RepID=A0A8C6WQP8_9GOBI
MDTYDRRECPQLKMQGAIARLCVVVAAAVFNPILFPHENTTLPEQDDQLLARMKEHEERLAKEQLKLEEEISQLEEKQVEQEDYSWYIWSTVSFIIFLTIELCRGNFDLEFSSIEDENESETVCPRTMALSKDILQNFSDKCSSAREKCRLKEFMEGFADDLLKALCSTDTDMEIGDFVGIGSLFESRQVCKPLSCDLIVPFSPPDPYYYRFCLSDIPPNMQGCGVIRVSRFGDEGCLCGSANLGDDMICLLHPSNNNFKAERSPDELLCCKNSNILSKHQVMKWFQISVTKSWSKISHKYDFELTFCNLDAAGAFKVRLPSGKVIILNLIPAVQFEDSDAYFVTRFPLISDCIQDPYWPISFAVYENKMLKYYTKRLPQNSCHLHCLQIATFLHRKQIGLTGENTLTHYHFKTALLHLLINKRPYTWSSSQIDQRLKDLLDFVKRSLQEKRLNHAVIGNSKMPKEIQIPQAFLKADPVNLFRSLVLDRKLNEATWMHFQEMLKNAPALLQEYTPMMTNGGMHLRLNEI